MSLLDGRPVCAVPAHRLRRGDVLLRGRGRHVVTDVWPVAGEVVVRTAARKSVRLPYLALVHVERA